MTDKEIDSIIESAMYNIWYQNPDITNDELDEGLLRYIDKEHR